MLHPKTLSDISTFFFIIPKVPKLLSITINLECMHHQPARSMPPLSTNKIKERPLNRGAKHGHGQLDMIVLLVGGHAPIFSLSLGPIFLEANSDTLITILRLINYD